MYAVSIHIRYMFHHLGVTRVRGQYLLDAVIAANLSDVHDLHRLQQDCGGEQPMGLEISFDVCNLKRKGCFKQSVGTPVGTRTSTDPGGGVLIIIIIITIIITQYIYNGKQRYRLVVTVW